MSIAAKEIKYPHKKLNHTENQDKVVFAPNLTLIEVTQSVVAAWTNLRTRWKKNLNMPWIGYEVMCHNNNNIRHQ